MTHQATSIFVRRLLLAVAMGFPSGMALSAEETIKVVQLDPAVLSLGNLPIAAKGENVDPPSHLPDKISATESDTIAVEENFTNGVQTLSGHSVVLRRQSPDGRCGLEYLFPNGGLSPRGEISFEAAILVGKDDQRGNIAFHFRGPKREVLFYLQIGAGGRLAVTSAREPTVSLPLDISINPDIPTRLKIVLDFTKREAVVFLNEVEAGGPVPIDDSQPITIFGLGVHGPEAKRVLAVHSLSISQK